MNNLPKLEVVFWNVEPYRRATSINAWIRQLIGNGVDVLCLSRVTDYPTSECSSPRVRLSPCRHEEFVHLNGYEQIVHTIGNYFHLTYDPLQHSTWYCFAQKREFRYVGQGNLIAWRKDLTFKSYGNALLDSPLPQASPVGLQWVIIEKPTERYLVGNLYGLELAENCVSSEESRRQQWELATKKLRSIVPMYKVDRIILGAEATFMLGTDALTAGRTDLSLRNLVPEEAITSAPTHEHGQYTDRQTRDHVLVSSKLNVEQFYVQRDISCTTRSFAYVKVR